MKNRNITDDYNKMMRIHSKMEAYERLNHGNPSPVLQCELDALLSPYIEPHGEAIERSETQTI